MHDYGNLALRRVGVLNPEHSMTVDSDESRSPYGVLALDGESCFFYLFSGFECCDIRSYSFNPDLIA